MNRDNQITTFLRNSVCLQKQKWICIGHKYLSLRELHRSSMKLSGLIETVLLLKWKKFDTYVWLFLNWPFYNSEVHKWPALLLLAKKTYVIDWWGIRDSPLDSHYFHLFKAIENNKPKQPNVKLRECKNESHLNPSWPFDWPWSLQCLML